MTAGAEIGPGMPLRHQASALVIYQSSVSLLPALLGFFLDGSADLSITSKPNPQSSGLGMSSSFFSSEAYSVGWVPSSSEPFSLCPRVDL